LYDFWAL